MFTDSPSTTAPSCPAGSTDGQSRRYNPRLLGGGAVVPYIGSWTGEELRPTTVIQRSGGIGYADETLLDRDDRGVLWTRVAGRIGMGKPLFTKLHPVRQRRAMKRLLCQVCAQPADHTEQGELWLVPDTEIGKSAGWPGGMSTIHPPLCRPCARVSVRMCPALRPRFVAIRARSHVCGVTGVVFGPGHRFPRPLDDDDEIIGFGDPAIRWVQATLLARSLYQCALLDPNELS